jgi:hypothetical protein
MMIGPRHAVEEIAHPWEGGHSQASAALVAWFGPSNGTFKNAEPPPLRRTGDRRPHQRPSVVIAGRPGCQLPVPIESACASDRLGVGGEKIV